MVRQYIIVSSTVCCLRLTPTPSYSNSRLLFTMSAGHSRMASNAAGSDSPHKGSTLKCEQVTLKPTRDNNHRELRISMHGKVVMLSYNTFMEECVEKPRTTQQRYRPPKNVFKDMAVPQNEATMYQEIVSGSCSLVLRSMLTYCSLNGSTRNEVFARASRSSLLLRRGT